jgi:hypothetical protein
VSLIILVPVPLFPRWNETSIEEGESVERIDAKIKIQIDKNGINHA